MAPRPLTWAINRHIVGRVGKDHSSALLAHQGYEVGWVEGIAAQNEILPKEPQISGFADRRPRGKFGNSISGVVSRVGHVLERGDAQIDLAHLKASELQAEVEVEERQVFEQLRQ
jgi:hypothetical protein